MQDKWEKHTSLRSYMFRPVNVWAWLNVNVNSRVYLMYYWCESYIHCKLWNNEKKTFILDLSWNVCLQFWKEHALCTINCKRLWNEWSNLLFLIWSDFTDRIQAKSSSISRFYTESIKLFFKSTPYFLVVFTKSIKICICYWFSIMWK